MHAALSYLGSLPPQTIVYNGHEYTKSSLAFAKSVDPQNAGLARLEGIVKENQSTTGLTTIGDEKEWNPFMRLESEPIRLVLSIARVSSRAHKVYAHRKATGESSDSAVMDALRELKNNYRG